MRITLEYRNPTPAHCTVAVFVNGALAGELVLRQEELVDFELILRRGISTSLGDSILSRGKSLPEEAP